MSTTSHTQRTPDLSRGGATERYRRLRVDRTHQRRKRALVIAIAALVCVAVVAAGLYVSHLNSLMTTQDNELRQHLQPRTNDDPFYVLLLGVDKGEERYDTEGEDASNYRSDTIMLVRIDPANMRATIVSIHRDLLVELPNGTEGKINAAYSLGGPTGMVQAVNALAGVAISHYAEIDFDSFMNIVDALGGVEVTLPVDVRDPDYTGLDLAAGAHVLNGHDALMLCRSRHAYDAYGDGDVYRAANQRMVIAAIVRKVLASDPATMAQAITAMAESVTTDMSLSDVLGLATQMRSFDTDTDLYTGMTPTEPEIIDGIYYELMDEEAWRAMMARVDAGLPPYESAEDDQTVGIAGSVADPGAEGDADTSAPAEKGALSGVERDGLVTVIGYPNGEATALAADLQEQGFSTVAYEEADFVFYDHVVVYSDAAYADEAEALAAYLGDAYQAVPNNGGYYTPSEILIRVGLS